jgi:hypothetical protein
MIHMGSFENTENEIETHSCIQTKFILLKPSGNFTYDQV